MTLGCLVLAHGALHRVAELCRALHRDGAAIAVHVDARADPAGAAAFAAAVADLPNLRLVPRRACDWGMWSLVGATLAGAELLLAAFPAVRHVVLMSGACLPVRPLADLRDHLARAGRTDFIESVDVGAGRWVQGGLSEERFTLHFPFSWRRQRRLFDLSVRLQRRLGVRRRLPHGLVPHIGSQWWCLTRETLGAILGDPRRGEFEAFFARTWIPDETFFQTLARRHAVRIESRSLTFSRFDHQGKPHLFYDDHADLLDRTDCFLARKIWPGADGLYARFLAPDRQDARGPDFRPGPLEHPFRAAAAERCEGRPGLLSAGRFPSPWFRREPLTPRPCLVFEGFDLLAPGWHAVLGADPGHVAHGRLFAPGRVEFAGGATLWRGNLPANPKVRDLDPGQFLGHVLRHERAPRVSLQVAPGDEPRALALLRRDPQAKRFVLGDQDLLARFLAGPKPDGRRRAAAQEAAHPPALVLPLAEAVADPARAFRTLLGTALGAVPREALPPFAPLAGLAAFAEAEGHPAAASLARAEAERAVRAALLEPPPVAPRARRAG